MANDHIITTSKACGGPQVNTTMIKFNNDFVTTTLVDDTNVGYHCVHTFPGTTNSCCDSLTLNTDKTYAQLVADLNFAITNAPTYGTGTVGDPYQI